MVRLVEGIVWSMEGKKSKTGENTTLGRSPVVEIQVPGS